MLTCTPRFCPNPACELYSTELKEIGWYKKYGAYSTQSFGKIQRFQCLKCKRGFSAKTFHIDFQAKKIVDYYDLTKSLVMTANTRDLSRKYNVSTGTIQNKEERLKRQIIAYHAGKVSSARLKEDLVADGFESFAVSQYFPDNIHLLVGRDSQFIYSMDYTTIRRKGRMTEQQKKKRSSLEQTFKADPQWIRKSFRNIAKDIGDLAARSSLNPVHLITDKKREYPTALNDVRVTQELLNEGKLVHERYSSKLARTRTNPLFAVNYIDRQLRKNLANHVRETVQFSRNVNDGLSRLWIFLLEHNYFKQFRIARREYEGVSHGDIAGIHTDDITRSRGDIFTRRAFLGLSKVTGYLKEHWLRSIKNPLKKKDEYLPAYAYV